MHRRWLVVLLISVITAYGCTIYQKTRPIHDVPFWERSQSKVDGEVRVTVAVLTGEESRQLFGLNLAGQGIQPVWVRVQNADTIPYWLLSTGLDPDYFSPLESAYAFHGTFSSSMNAKIDDQFRVMAFRNPIVPDAAVSGFIYFAKRQQDFAGQKPRHTVHQRNHLRAWLSPMRYQGKSVWIGQISRDIGVRTTFKTWPPVTHKIDPDIDEARISLIEDLIYSQQLARTGWVKGVGAADRRTPRFNLTGDPYFTDGYRAVLVFDRRPRSFMEIDQFDWEQPISNRIERLETDQQPDFDEQ